MAGYVAVKLLRHYSRKPKKPSLIIKYDICTKILKTMQAEHQPTGADSVESYSTLWEELIDRGGLYHISDDVYHLVEAVEVVVRHFLNIDQPVVHENLYKLVKDKAVKTGSVMMGWEKICSTMPSKYEIYMMELLDKVIEVWVTIRGHSFTKIWTMKFEKRKYQEGTRKTLQPEREN